MHAISPIGSRNSRSRTCIIGIWLAGLFVGMFVAVGAGDTCFFMMRNGTFSVVSIPGLLVLALPFLITAVAVYFSLSWLLYLLVFCKAISFGFSACAVTIAFSGAAWLVRFLLLFGNGCAILPLMWLWLHCKWDADRGFPVQIGLCTAAALVMGILDFCVVSPFAALLL